MRGKPLKRLMKPWNKTCFLFYIKVLKIREIKYLLNNLNKDKTFLLICKELSSACMAYSPCSFKPPLSDHLIKPSWTNWVLLSQQPCLEGHSLHLSISAWKTDSQHLVSFRFPLIFILLPFPFYFLFPIMIVELQIAIFTGVCGL